MGLLARRNKSTGGKKKPTSWKLLLVAALIGVGAFYLTSTYLANKEASLREQLLGDTAKTIDVVVATTDLLPGDIVGPGNMAVASLLAEHVSRFSVTPDMFADYQDHVLERPMSQGEPLLTHFMAGDAVERFSELLEEGSRSVTLEIDEIATNAYMLRAGDFVDIFLLMESGDLAISGAGENEKILAPLLKGVRIIATGSNSLLSTKQQFVRQVSADEDAGYSTVTVGVPVKDAVRLEMARETGKLVFLLRNPDDKEDGGHIRAVNQSILAALGLGRTGENASYMYYAGGQSAGGVLRPVRNQIGRTAKQHGPDKALLRSVASEAERGAAESADGNKDAELPDQAR